MPRETCSLEDRQRLVERVRAGQRAQRADAIDRGKGRLSEADQDRQCCEMEEHLELEREEKESRTKPWPGSLGSADRGRADREKMAEGQESA